MGPKWTALLADLSVCFGREFEAICERVLRPAWPGVRQVPPMSPLDEAGVDLVSFDRFGNVELAFQCKTTRRIPVPIDWLVGQMRADVDKLLRSGLDLRTFVYAINATGITPGDWAELRQLLTPLSAGRHGLSYHVVSPAELVELAWNKTKERIDKDIQIQTVTQHIGALQTVFAETQVIPRVPARVTTIGLEDAAGAVTRDERTDEYFDLHDLSAPEGEGRVTLLTGMFGAGKSTAVGCLVTGSQGSCFSLPCRELPMRWAHPLSVHDVLTWLLVFLGPSSVGPEEERQYVVEAMGDVLKDRNWRKTIIFDGLDEHRLFCTPDGFAELAGVAGRLGCNIVFTVRREFVDAELGRYESSMRRLCAQMSLRTVTKVELQPWGIRHLVELIDINCEPALPWKSSPDQTTVARWTELRSALLSGEAREHYGDSLDNPLLFKYLMEDVAENGIRDLNRAEVLFGHIRRKVLRDREVATRSLPGSDLASREWWARMMTALMLCALCIDEARVEIGNSAPGDSRREEFTTFSWNEARGFFSVAFPDGATKDDVRSCGLFVASVNTILGQERLYFTHKALQDFLVSLSLECYRRDHEDEVILGLRDDIQRACRLRRNSHLAQFVAAHVSRLPSGTGSR